MRHQNKPTTGKTLRFVRSHHWPGKLSSRTIYLKLTCAFLQSGTVCILIWAVWRKQQGNTVEAPYTHHVAWSSAYTSALVHFLPHNVPSPFHLILSWMYNACFILCLKGKCCWVCVCASCSIEKLYCNTRDSWAQCTLLQSLLSTEGHEDWVTASYEAAILAFCLKNNWYCTIGVCVVVFFGINMSPNFKMVDIPIFSSSLLLFGGLTLLGVNDKHIKCTQLTF